LEAYFRAEDESLPTKLFWAALPQFINASMIDQSLQFSYRDQIMDGTINLKESKDTARKSSICISLYNADSSVSAVNVASTSSSGDIQGNGPVPPKFDRSDF